MKRINQTTNEPFKRGDVRADGYIFFAYTKNLKTDGFFKEIWVNPESSNKIKERDRKHKKQTYVRKTTRLPQGYKRLLDNNPKAIAQFKFCWHRKNEDPSLTKEDLEDMMFGYEKYLPLLLGE